MVKFALFGRLKKAAVGPRGPPVERVRNLTAQGIGESEIIRILKNEGYTFEQIDEALTGALKGEAAPAQPAALAGPQVAAPPPRPDVSPEEAAEVYGYPAPPPSAEYPREEFLPVTRAGEEAAEFAEAAPAEERFTEEILEEMVEERFGAVNEKFGDVDMRLRGAEDRMAKMTAQIADWAAKVKAAQDDLASALETTNSKLAELEPRTTSLEKAFKDIVPNLVDTVREVREFVVGRKRAPQLRGEEMEAEA